MADRLYPHRLSDHFLAPIARVMRFFRNVRREQRISRAEDFDFFVTRPLDPERTRSLFA